MRDSLVSHKRGGGSSGRRRGGRSGGGGGSGGGGSGGGGGENTGEEYQKAANVRINSFLKERKYTQAGFASASFAFQSTKPNELASVLLAGIVALREGEKKGWKAKPEELARTSLDASLRISKQEFSEERKSAVAGLIAREVRKAAGGAP